MTAMKHARFIAATVLAALLLAGFTGRRTAGDAADKASADDGTSETAVSTPEPTGEETPAGERSPLAASRTWTGSDGSSKRWGPFAENDTTFLFVHEYLIGSGTNRDKVRSRTTFPILQAFRRRTSRHGRISPTCCTRSRNAVPGRLHTMRRWPDFRTAGRRSALSGGATT